ncbi:hypothetical protein PATSB16_41510 [Pandoraea thiooxydans]|nr:hypothetical protein PATSB16_41510 [Pandoraea thiooxydans]
MRKFIMRVNPCLSRIGVLGVSRDFFNFMKFDKPLICY